MECSKCGQELPIVKCAHCGNSLPQTRSNRRFCSTNCKIYAHLKAKRIKI